MSALNPFRPIVGLRPVTCRVHVLFRVDPVAAAALLPAGVRPRCLRGYALAALCYTRLGRLGARWLPTGLAPSTEHLSYRLGIEPGEGERAGPGSWVLRRATSSWLRSRGHAQRGGKAQPADWRRASFELDQTATGFELSARCGDAEEVVLRAEVAPGLSRSVFASAAEAEEFLAAGERERSGDPSAPEPDGLGPDQAALAPEPLKVFELRAPFFQDGGVFPPGSIELDSALRLVSRRLDPVPARPAFRPVEHGETAPAVPGL